MFDGDICSLKIVRYCFVHDGACWVAVLQCIAIVVVDLWVEVVVTVIGVWV